MQYVAGQRWSYRTREQDVMLGAQAVVDVVVAEPLEARACRRTRG